jgi:large subunit ribosomal protein L10
LAFTKKEKEALMEQYHQWVSSSQAVYVLSYSGMNMKEIDALRAKARETGSEVHVVKNTLMNRVLKEKQLPGEEFFDGPSIVGFAFSEAPALAKVLSDATKGDVFKLKGGLLGTQRIDAAQIKNLAELPPLPIMRAQLLGVLNAPASKLVRTIAEPARGLAAVVNAYAKKESGEAVAA